MSDASGSSATGRSRDAGVLVMGRLLATLSDALLPLALVRLLGKTEVGVLSSVLMVYTTVALILATGFPTALMFYLPGRPPEERQAIARLVAKSLFGFGVLAAALIAATSGIALLDGAWPQALGGEDGTALVAGGVAYLALLAPFPLGDMPARMLPNLLVIENQTDSAARFTIAKSIASAVFVLVPAGLGADIELVLTSYSAFGLLQGLAFVYYMRTLYPAVARATAPVRFAELARFALPLGLTDIVSMLNSRFDRYLISISFPLAAFAEYQIGAFQIPLLTTIAYSVGTVYTPFLTEKLREGRADEAIAVWRASVYKVSLIVVPISAIFVVAAEEVIELLFTPAYLAAAPVFRCYALLTMGRVAAFGSVIVAAGKPQLVVRSAALSLAANAFCCVIGLLLFGFVGPAIGAAVAFVPMVVIYCHYIAKATGLRLSQIFPFVPYLRVLLLTAAACVPAVALKLATPWTATPKLLAIAALVICAFTLLGALTGHISRADFQYLRHWLSLRSRPASRT